MHAIRTVNRRGFLKKSAAGGAGLVIGLYLPGKHEALAGTPPKDPTAINAWVQIAPDDTVRIRWNSEGRFWRRNHGCWEL